MPRALSDDEAWIVSHNLLLVDYYLRNRTDDAATQDDLRAAGYLGLCHAIRLYDPAIAPWTTYAFRWIRRCIQLEIQQRSLLHVPYYHRSNIKTATLTTSKKRYGVRAGRALTARPVQWNDGEAIAVLAVTLPEEPRDERYQIIKDYLCDLSADEQSLVRRVVMGGERTSDVARDIGLSNMRAGQIRSRAIRILKLRLAEEWPELKLPCVGLDSKTRPASAGKESK